MSEATENTSPFESLEPCFVYTWDQCIKDGVFVDVSENALRNGLKFPTAITTNLFRTHVCPNRDEGDEGRLGDLLMAFARAIVGLDDDFVEFSVTLTHKEKVEDVTVWGVCEARSPDNPEPIFTLMLPEDR